MLTRSYSKAERFLKPGVHIACFALRPVFQRGFDILVRKDFGYMLPTTQLSSLKLEGWQLKIIQSMDNWTVASLCATLRRSSVFSDQKEQQFIRVLLEAITALASQIDRPFFQSARLVARLLRAPSASSSSKEGSSDAFVLAFRIIADIHQNHGLVDPYEFAPSKFFLVRQHAFKDSPDNQIFARKIHREFAAVAEGHDDWTPNALPPRYSIYPAMDRRLSSVRRGSRSESPARNGIWPSRRPSPTATRTDDNASDHSKKNLVDPIKSLGGIQVSNEASVDVSKTSSGGSSPDVKLTTIPLCCTTEAGVGDIESENFADELMLLTTDERRRQHSGVSD